jgi:hypothetical protein
MYPALDLWCAILLSLSTLFSFLEYHATIVRYGTGEKYTKLFSLTGLNVFLTATFWTLFYVYK